MKPVSAPEMKAALKTRDAKELLEICQRLSRAKKENKELLSYLLFYKNDLHGYIAGVNEALSEGFSEVSSSAYLAKKMLRKLLRLANRHIRFTGEKTAEVEILLCYCANYQKLSASLKKNAALAKIYSAQVKKLEAAIAGLHPDLQYDYQRSLAQLSG